jgi:hypothetical protein
MLHPDTLLPMSEIMDSTDIPRPSRTERRAAFWAPIARRIACRAACRPAACFSNCTSDIGRLFDFDAFEDVSLGDLHESVSKSHEQLALHLATERLKRKCQSQERVWRSCRDELSKLSTVTGTLEKKLTKFWSFAAKFIEGREHCRARMSPSYLKLYQKLFLDFKPLSDYLGSLEHVLHGARRFLSKSQLWTSDAWEFRSLSSSTEAAEMILLAEHREAQSRLQELSEYEDVLDGDLQNVKEQQQQLFSVEDALNEEEKRHSDKRIERLERFIREVAIRLQMFVVLLLLFCKFSGVSDSDQPMCITMPWNIRPALIVLWGVCWMFYTPPGYVDPTSAQGAEVDGNADFSRLGKCSPLDNWSLHCADRLHIDWTSDELFRISDPNLFSYDQAMPAYQPILPGAIEASNTFLAPAFSAQPALDATFFNQIPYEEGPARSATLDPKDAFSSLNLTSPWETLPTSHIGNGYQSRRANGQPEDVFVGPVPSESQVIDRPNTYANNSTSPSRPPSGFDQPQQPIPPTPEGVTTCEHAQCRGLTFDRLSDLK